MNRLKKLITNWRVIILIIFLALSLIAINPHFSTQGVAIRQIAKNSSASIAGIENPGPTGTPTGRERVLAVNGQQINSVEQYYDAVQNYPANRTLTVTTTTNTYKLTTQIDPNSSYAKDIGIVVYPAPSTNIRLGLDLSGGTRVILKPKEQVSQDDLNLIIDNIKQRLNVFGLSDITVRSAKDLSGEDYIIVEIAGADKDEVQSLLSQQGKFEATIGNDTVFRGGKDITYVCRSADCSGIRSANGQGGCGQSGSSWVCPFFFQISLSPDAAQRQADLTRNLGIKTDTGGAYLTQPLALYLDNEKVDELQISADLRGRASTNIVISGSGTGQTQEAAAQDALANMKKLQTVLITGSLPVQLDIVKSDGISAVLGGEFIKNALLIGLLSIIAVTLVLIIRYRKAIIAFPIVLTMLSEVTIVLGFAAWVGWNLDLASIAAIIIAIGSGVDDQIVIIDETLHGGVSKSIARTWKEKLGTAFFIIFASYFTLVAAMIPLWFAGAGLLRGFAITTIVGVTAGVLVTRPAFAAIVEILLKKEEE